MGILKHLLFWPVTGPAFLAEFAMDKVRETVQRELTDDDRIKEELLALQMELELGEIDDAQYVEREAGLMRQLREVREWREKFGMPVSGGLVQVAQDEDEPPAREPEVVDPSASSVEVRLDWDDAR